MSTRRLAAILPIVAIVMAACTSSSPGASGGAGCKVGVAWATFQEPRYGQRDEPGIKKAIEDGGGEYLSGGDGQNKAETQASQIATLLAANIDVLVLNAVDPTAVMPSLEDAIAAGIPVIAYDRELESDKVLFLTHDNVLVGHMIAEEVAKVAPTGNYVIIKGDETQTNPIFLREGMEEVLAPLVDAGDVTVVAEEFTDDWTSENAQTNMENILTAHPEVDAVLSQNDNMATGVIAALGGNADGAVKIGGQDGDPIALNRVALGTQVVSVWKDATELGTEAGKAALELCEDPDISKVTGAVASKTTGGLDSYAKLLNPIPITKDNLQVVLDANWITKDDLCKDVEAGSVAGC